MSIDRVELLENIIVGFCENQLDRDELPLLYCRFVDDTFSIFSSKEKSEEFFLKLNRMNPALRLQWSVKRMAGCPSWMFRFTELMAFLNGLYTGNRLLLAFTHARIPFHPPARKLV